MTTLDLISRLQGNRDYRIVATYNAVNSFQPLEPQIGTEQTIADIVCTKLGLGMAMYAAELYIMLDYVAYTPFGKRGTKTLVDGLKGKYAPKQYKKKAFDIVIKNCGAEPEHFDRSFNRFLDYLYSSKQNWNDAASVAASVRIISGEIDSLVSKSKIFGLDERDRKLEEILNKILEHIQASNSREFDIEGFLPEVEDESFSEEESKYFFIIGV